MTAEEERAAIVRWLMERSERYVDQAERQRSAKADEAEVEASYAKADAYHSAARGIERSTHHAGKK